jgi:hypothetical protein
MFKKEIEDDYNNKLRTKLYKQVVGCLARSPQRVKLRPKAQAHRKKRSAAHSPAAPLAERSSTAVLRFNLDDDYCLRLRGLFGTE